MKKNLVVARCGPNSLHQNWIKNALPNFDLIITYYGDVVPESWINDGYPIYEIKGSKWIGLYEFLNKNEIWKNYERVFCQMMIYCLML